MSTPVDTSAVTQAITDPAASAADGQSVTARPVAEIVLGIQFAAAAAAAVLPHWGLRRKKMIPPPQVDGHAGRTGGPGPGGYC